MAKIETIKQQDLKDCGAICLECVIKYYNGYVPLEKIREDTCTNASGTTAFHLIKAAEEYGFDAMGIRVKDINDKNIYLPAIAHVVLKNGLEHFIVVYKIDKNYVWVMDPAKGKLKIKKDDFKAIWDNILILLTPISEIIHYDRKTNIFSVLLKLTSKNKITFTKICLINLIFMILTITSSFYFQIALSFIETGQDNNFIKFIVMVFATIALFKVIMAYIKNYYLTFFNKNIDTEIFTSFLSHILNLPLKFMQNRSTGEIISRVQELGEIKDLLSEVFTNILLNSVLIIGSIIALFLINDKLFLLLCLIIIIYTVISLVFTKPIYIKVKENLEIATDFNNVLVETVEMNSSIKNLNLTNNFIKKLEDKLILMLKSSFNLTNIINNINLIKNFVYEIGLFAVISYGIYLVYIGKLNILSLISFNSIVMYLFNPIKEIMDLIPKINYIRASFNKITEFINIEEEQQSSVLKKINNQNIEFKNVTYSYNKFSNILTKINFLIKSKEKVLLIGESGCGKSTICRLIYKYISNYSGEIKINNESEKDYDIKSIRNEIAYVNQEEKLFSGTIKENILCYRNIDEEAFLKVAKICKIEEIINKKPNRYETVINANLNNLSGGEKQRIILARGLLKKAKIIILDEALSEVNISLEKEIIDNIKEYYNDSTLIYISHKDVKDKFSKIINLGEINNECL